MRCTADIKKVLLLSGWLLLSAGSFAQILSPRSETEARRLADSLYSVLADGASFQQLVLKFSDDRGSNKKGGIYAAVKPGTFTPEFEEAVAGLKIHEISKPFRSPYGYHIAQVVQRSEEGFTVRHILISFKD